MEETNETFGQQSSRIPKKRFRFMTINDLASLPPPSWLIEGLIEDNVLGVLYGASGEGKSFIALDWALSVASERHWHGRNVHGGPVVYVVAEGSRSFGKRIKAWMLANNVNEVPDMFLILEAVQFTDQTHVAGLLDLIADLQPRLIVIDTLARCFNGEENSSQDMGKFVQAASEVQRATGATVLAVHHTGKGHNKNSERGSSALRGAADVMIRVSKKDSIVTIDVDKQKDDEAETGIRLRLTQVMVGVDDADNDITSCILLPAADAPPVTPTLPTGAAAALQTLLYEFEGLAGSGPWRKAIRLLNGKGMAQETFHRHKRKLLKTRSIEQVEGRSHWYQITEAGTVTAKRLPLACQRQLPTVSAATATPPIGVAGGTGEGESAAAAAFAGDPSLESGEGEGGDGAR